ncbi:MAG TPA: hypothetical protein VJQ08_10320 [Candidatus Dormibacteraeota bacterium]|nr:hypothetical protein [Candidatus Dormibacteraeota bacterium]
MAREHPSQQANLFTKNRPSLFWRLVDPIVDETLWTASALASYQAVFGETAGTVDDLLNATLGEGRFGPDHWKLSTAKRIYYELKPVLPRALTRRMRQAYGRGNGIVAETAKWPIDDRFVNFLLLTLTGVLDLLGASDAVFIDFWPESKSWAFVLTHDVETAVGQSHVIDVADLEARYGFRSSFSFIPERYQLDHGVINELKDRGFEVGVHDLRHDGKLFRSRSRFNASAEQINRHATELGATGFSAAYTHRNPEWMQALDFEYDLSFFDTDPYEPMPGGSLTIWPFFIGRFTELPYTLVQDFTLTAVLGATTHSIWTSKVEYIASRRGMALLKSHPDYLLNPKTRSVYEQFLAETANREHQPWHALPTDVARWWRDRSSAGEATGLGRATAAVIGTGGWGTIERASSGGYERKPAKSG